jgi:prepilin-type N-terminal cleavage/methylation domain-containing protein
MRRSRRQRPAFTLLEVIIALGILAVALMVLVNTQVSSVFMTTEGERVTTATALAEEKLKEIMIQLEREGWASSDIDEEGDFANFGEEDFRGGGLEVEHGDDLADYKFAYTVRRIELTLPSDLGGTAQQLAGSGMYGEAVADQAQQADVGGMPDISAFIKPNQISEYLADYFREVRILVWWGENEDKTDQVEIVHHVINPSGMVNDPETEK